MGAAPILTILKDGETVRSLPIEGEVVLGRSQGCVIRLEDRAISRQHAVFRPLPDGVQVERKSEFAPLMVNGADCTSAIIKEGDVIAIGPYLMKLKLQAEKAAPAPAASAAPVMSPESEPEGAALASVLSMPSMPSIGDNGMVPETTPEVPSNAEPDAGMSLPVMEGAPAENPPMPEPTSMMAMDEGAATRLIAPEKVVVKLLFQDGEANCTEFEVTQDEVSIGRGKNCDIVLNDKKSSRKNSIIRRAGLNFVIKDLGSANGTYVNGVRVDEQELGGDDVIQVGDVEFQFKVVSADYAAKEKDFLAVSGEDPAEQPMGELALDLSSPADQALAMSAPQAAPAVPGMDPLGGAPGMAGAIPGAIPGVDMSLAGIPGVGQSGGKPKTLMEKFRALPKSRQYMWIAIVAGLAIMSFFDEEEEIQKKPKTAQVQKKGAAGKGAGKVTGVTFQALNPEQRKFVEGQHTLAFDLYKARDYDKAIFEIEKIFALGLEDYKDSREILRYAQEGKRKLEAMESEKRRKQEEARVKARVAQLEIEGTDLLSKRAYPQLQEIMAELLSLDPENGSVSKWKSALEREEEEARAKAQRAQVRTEIDREAWRIHKAGLLTFKKGRYRSALEIFEKVPGLGSEDARLKKANDRMVRRSRLAIRNTLEPLLSEAKQLETSGEYAKAFKLFLQASKVDPQGREAPQGMARIRGVLHEKARALYTEAVLAESYSDLAFAKRKYQEIIESTPVEDIYYERASRKLARFLKREEAPAP